MDSVLAERFIKTRNSHCVSIKANEFNIKHINVLRYFVNVVTRKVEAHLRAFRFANFLSEDYCPYIFSVEEDIDESITNVKFLVRPLVRIDAHDKTYLGIMPNRYQKSE